MRKLRQDYYDESVGHIRRELMEMQISQRCAASQLGMSHSTFNAFLNQEYTRPNPRTIAKLLSAPVWSEPAKHALIALRDYEHAMFCAVRNMDGLHSANGEFTA